MGMIPGRRDRNPKRGGFRFGRKEAKPHPNKYDTPLDPVWDFPSPLRGSTLPDTKPKAKDDWGMTTPGMSEADKANRGTNQVQRSNPEKKSYERPLFDEPYDPRRYRAMSGDD